MRILAQGFICSPTQGSEYRTAWNWAAALATHHEVWLLAHPFFRAEIEAWLARHPEHNLHCEWVSVPRSCDPWDGEMRPRNYGYVTHYLLWQWAALRAARRLQDRYDFALAHHVSYSTINVAPLLWRLGLPFVWGPIGGAQTVPQGLDGDSRSARAAAKLRAARLRLLPLLPNWRGAVARSAVILSTNQETSRLLRRSHARRVESFLDSGIPAEEVPPAPPTRDPGTRVTLLWAGAFERWKALPLALEALALLRDRRLRLLVAGDGPCREEWQQAVRHLGLEDVVTFLGTIPWRSMFDLYRQADIFVFTSLCDSFGTQVLEAMSQGLPVVALDHQGVGAFLSSDAGVKVAVTTRRDVVRGLGEAIRGLAESPVDRRRLGESAWEFARNETWDARAARMSLLYSRILPGDGSMGDARTEVSVSGAPKEMSHSL